LSARLHKKLAVDLAEIFMGRVDLAQITAIRFWWQTMLPPSEYKIVYSVFCIRQVAASFLTEG